MNKLNMLDAITAFDEALAYEVKPQTRRWYGHMLSALADELGDVPLADVTAADLRRWRNVVYEGMGSDNSRNAHLRAVKRLFNWCISEGLITSNPASALSFIRVSNREKKAVELADFQAMLYVARSRRNWRDVAVILFLLGTGARVSALCGLQIKNLDLVNGRAWVAKKSRNNDEFYWVYLDGVVIQAIRDYFAYERRDNLKPDDYVFPGRKGPLHRGSVWQTLRRYGDWAGVSGCVNPHSFRHAFAILRLQAGEDLVSLKDLMGHSTIKVTAESYGRFQRDQLQAIHQAYSPLAGVAVEIRSERAVK